MPAPGAGMSKTAEPQELWGAETAKAVANFPVSGEPIPASVARWLGRIKGAAARVNADLGLLDPDKTRPSASFPHDIFMDESLNPFINKYQKLYPAWDPPARWTSGPCTPVSFESAGTGSP